MSDNLFTFACPLCLKKLEAEIDLAGESIECPACNKSIQVPCPVTFVTSESRNGSGQSSSQGKNPFYHNIIVVSAVLGVVVIVLAIGLYFIFSDSPSLAPSSSTASTAVQAPPTTQLVSSAPQPLTGTLTGTNSRFYLGETIKRRDAQSQAKPDPQKTMEQNNMGYRYLTGDGVEKNITEAVKWLSLAARNGNPNAQCTLGAMYHQGLGVEQDDSKAFNLLSQSAAQGFAAAEENLGMVYHNGWGVQSDDAKAIQWLKKASEHGDKNASKGLLALYYENFQKSKKLGAEKNPPDRDAAEQFLTSTADTVVQLKIDHGDLISASRNGFTMEYVSGKSDLDAKADVGYTFTFKTQAGATQQHDGYLHFNHNPLRKDWFNSEINIDGSPIRDDVLYVRKITSANPEPDTGSSAQQSPQPEQPADVRQKYINTSYPRFVGLYQSVNQAASVAQRKNAMQQGTREAAMASVISGGSGTWVGPRVGKYKFHYDEQLDGYVVYQE